jgi:hypothetical protein
MKVPETPSLEDETIREIMDVTFMSDTTTSKLRQINGIMSFYFDKLMERAGVDEDERRARDRKWETGGAADAAAYGYDKRSRDAAHGHGKRSRDAASDSSGAAGGERSRDAAHGHGKRSRDAASASSGAPRGERSRDAAADSSGADDGERSRDAAGDSRGADGGQH